VFGVSRAGWRPDLPDACRKPFAPLLWLKVHELLGRVPAGSTARFVKDGTLPGAKGDTTGYRARKLRAAIRRTGLPLTPPRPRARRPLFEARQEPRNELPFRPFTACTGSRTSHAQSLDEPVAQRRQ
jgi:hypothetical protein